jgi:hypothetical protein
VAGVAARRKSMKSAKEPKRSCRDDGKAERKRGAGIHRRDLHGGVDALDIYMYIYRNSTRVLVERSLHALEISHLCVVPGLGVSVCLWHLNRCHLAACSQHQIKSASSNPPHTESR